MVWWTASAPRLLGPSWRKGLLVATEQRATLVNVKLKWVKDRCLDSVVARERHLRQVHRLLERISSDPRGGVSAHEIRSWPPVHLGNFRLMPSEFFPRFPAIFRISSSPSPAAPGPWFHLTDDALHLRELELRILRDNEPDLVDRLRRLLMLTEDRSLPLHTLQQLSWDVGLPLDFHKTLTPRFPHFFALARPQDDERVWLTLSSWDPRLAVSELQRNCSSSGDGFQGAFPVSFTRGFGLRRKCMMWLQEWQALPYTSPYADPAGLDPRTDISEKRIVGVFHELLHLTIGKKTERMNLSNLQKPLRLPQKFTKVFERHPGIFYLSQKLGVQTVVLREAYGGGRELLEKHPLVTIRESYATLMRLCRSERGGAIISSEVCCTH